MAAQVVPLSEFESTFGSLIELSSEALGASIVSVSDEFFAKAECLLRVEPSVSMKGQFSELGAMFDGWETRRHNPNYDWVIIKLGALGTVLGCDIDTGHFNGNESPASGVWGARVPEGETIAEDSKLWTPLLSVTPLGPAQRHLFKFDKISSPVTHLKLTQHPDGGLGRFRAYGHVIPPPGTSSEPIDLAHVLNGGTVTGQSDQHFGKGMNLIMPGRGKNMGDGFETKRSRGRLGTGKGDWVVIKLGEAGFLETVDLDTNHFIGNFPESVELFAINSNEKLPNPDSSNWVEILDRTKLGPHRQHFFQLLHSDKIFSHVKLVLLPDGGMKRARIFGRPASKFPTPVSHVTLNKTLPTPADSATNEQTAPSESRVPRLPAVPLTPDAFAPFGHVIQSYADTRSVRKDIVLKRVNFGTATKFNHLAPVKWIQPETSKHANLTPEINFCVFRCDAQNGNLTENGKARWEVSVLERHEFSSQAFIPMGRSTSENYLVIVCLPDSQGEPDLNTLRAFMASTAQGISYHPNVWHHPIIALDAVTDFSCIVYETGLSEIDCEIRQFGKTVAVVDAL